MSQRPRAHKEWEIRASKSARKTQNPIREIVEHMNPKPNPDKKFITLSVGDPTAFGNLKPPENVIQAVYDVLPLNESRSYGPTIGHEAARQAVADYSAHQGTVSANDVILASGCNHAIEMALTVIADAGQNILVPRPGYLIYKAVAESLGTELRYYDLLPDINWQVDLQNLESQIDEDTAAIIINNPSNPCGSVFPRDHLKDIIAIASRNRVPIIADEIYEHFVFSGHEFVSISSLSEDVPVLTCSGVTKRFLIPGWRMGWVIIHDRHNILNKEVRKGLMNVSSRILGPNTLIQQALPRILKDTPQGYFHKMVSFIESQAQLAYRILINAPGLRPVMPQGSMYMMIEVKITAFPQLGEELQFIKQLCEEQSVLCIPGKCFDYPNFMRIVLTVPEDILQEACNRIAQFCEHHIAKKDKITDKDTDNIVSIDEQNTINKNIL